MGTQLTSNYTWCRLSQSMETKMMKETCCDDFNILDRIKIHQDIGKYIDNMKLYPNVTDVLQLMKESKNGWMMDGEYYIKVVSDPAQKRKLKEIHLNYMTIREGKHLYLSIMRSKSGVHGEHPWGHKPSLLDPDFEVAFIYPDDTYKIEGHCTVERLEELLDEFDDVYPQHVSTNRE